MNILAKIKGWTSRKAVKIICFVLIITAGFVVLNRLSASFELTRESGVGAGVIFTNLDDNSFFERKHLWQAVNAAHRVRFYSDLVLTQADMDFSWEIRHYEARLWSGGEIVRSVIGDFSIVNLNIEEFEDDVRPWLSEFQSELAGLLSEIEREVHNEIVEPRQRSLDREINSFVNTPGLLYYLSIDRFSRPRFHLANIDDIQDHITARSVFHLSEHIHGFSTTFLAFEEDFVIAWNNYYRQIQTMHVTNVLVIAASILLALICFVVLIFGAGRKYAVQGVFISRFNRVFLDIGLVVLVIWSFVVLFVSFELGGAATRFQTHDVVVNIIFALMSVAALTPVIFWLISFTERVKAGQFWEYTFVYFIISKSLNAAKTLWAGSHLTIRVAVIGGISFFVLISAGLSGFARLEGTVLFVAVIYTAVVVYFLLRYARRLHNLERQAFKTAEGDYSEKIDVTGGELGSIAQSINEISAGINTAVELRLKSERLKTELITNVSHDIRTPLTSVITYTDLLKKEGLDCEKAPEYLEIIIQKSERLKILTDELFEAAKAASGNIGANLAELDFVSLIKQVLGELDETIKNSGLNLRVNLPQRLDVVADGKLMWRVMENLMSNVFKYALPGSRVYLELKQADSAACFELKNISAMELNVDPAELTERFKRGDDSRTDGGAGLGLSIVQSFVAAQGGKFEIHIDGDLFKATVCVPRKK